MLFLMSAAMGRPKRMEFQNQLGYFLYLLIYFVFKEQSKYILYNVGYTY